MVVEQKTLSFGSAQAVLLVGGLGKRLGKHTEHTPKPLLDVGGQPFLFHILDHLTDCGFNRVLLLTGYLSHHLKKFCRKQIFQSWT